MSSIRTRRLRLLAVGALAVGALTACSDDASTSGAGQPLAVGHVHGLGVDPVDGALYLGAHGGVFRVDDDGPTLVADRVQDTMAFVVTGPARFLASGHPGSEDTDRPTHLGLIETTDAAQSWDEVSLSGEADFHSLDVGTSIVGYDGLSGRILASTDRRSWSSLWEGAVLDLTVFPGSDEVLATTPDAGLIALREGSAPIPIDDAPPLLLVDSVDEKLVVGADADGQAWVSRDRGLTWAAAGEPQGAVQALDATETVWHLATEAGVVASRDLGVTWTSVLEYTS